MTQTHLLSFAHICLSFYLLSGLPANQPITPLHRISRDPILSSQGSSWESEGVFNPAVIFQNGKFVMFYRAQDKNGISRLGYAESSDGIHFTRHPQPVLSP